MPGACAIRSASNRTNDLCMLDESQDNGVLARLDIRAYSDDELGVALDAFLTSHKA
jgi:hypothetical protein